MTPTKNSGANMLSVMTNVEIQQGKEHEGHSDPAEHPSCAFCTLHLSDEEHRVFLEALGVYRLAPGSPR